jgi:DNA polymerase bacteriophage-type
VGFSVIFIDFETRSRCDLSTAGAWRYSKHPSTEITVVAWAVDDGEPQLWFPDPFRPDAVPEAFRLDSSLFGDEWCAHNAFFEMCLWENRLCRDFEIFTPLRSEWVDTQALSLQKGLPGGLDDCTAVLFPYDPQWRKDKAGAALMRKMCAPTDAGYHWTAADVARLGAYCQQDVRATRAIYRTIGPGQKSEEPIIALDRKINLRGFRLDVPLATAAYHMAAAFRTEAEQEISRLTSGAITSPGQHARIKKWTGLPSARPELEKALNTLPPDDPRRELLTLINDSNRSSVTKYAAALASADTDDHRIRGSLQYHQAFTGRWAGRGFQPQNLPRGVKPFNEATPERQQAIDAVLAGDTEAIRQRGNPLDVLASLIRACVVPAPEHQFIAADFSSIEARGVFWLAGQDDACRLLKSGGDLYTEMAATIYGVPAVSVTKDQRQVGKSAVLGCGYGMGAQRFGQNAGTDPITSEAAVDGYRRRFPRVPQLWSTLENMFRRADVRLEGPRGIRMFAHTDGRRRVIRLPSGRELTYWDVQVTGDRISYMTMYKGTWTRVDTWGGKLCENVVSGIAADLLREAMVRVELAGWPIVLTVHDEIICEEPDWCCLPDGRTPEALAAIMSDLTGVLWADGFPLEAKGWAGKRFQK